MGMMMLISWLQFLNMTYIYSMNQQHSANMVFLGDMVFSVLNIGFMFAVSWLATRLDKRTVLVSGLVTMSVGVPLSFFYITPIYPILQLLWAVFLAPGMAAVWLLTNSCIADFCDEDELCTGARREGFYGAVYSFSMKAGAGVGLGIAGILLDLIGFDKELIEQSHETILKFRWTFAVIPAVFFALAAWMAALYPITRMRHDVIKQQLTMKKNEIGVNP
jgi:GPH family glycoside/pentoside/hexuronide:cation symporter